MSIRFISRINRRLQTARLAWLCPAFILIVLLGFNQYIGLAAWLCAFFALERVWEQQKLSGIEYLGFAITLLTLAGGQSLLGYSGILSALLFSIGLGFGLPLWRQKPWSDILEHTGLAVENAWHALKTSIKAQFDQNHPDHQDEDEDEQEEWEDDAAPSPEPQSATQTTPRSELDQTTQAPASYVQRQAAPSTAAKTPSAEAQAPARPVPVVLPESMTLNSQPPIHRTELFQHFKTPAAPSAPAAPSLPLIDLSQIRQHLQNDHRVKTHNERPRPSEPASLPLIASEEIRQRLSAIHHKTPDPTPLPSRSPAKKAIPNSPINASPRLFQLEPKTSPVAARIEPTLNTMLIQEDHTEPPLSESLIQENRIEPASSAQSIRNDNIEPAATAHFIKVDDVPTINMAPLNAIEPTITAEPSLRDLTERSEAVAPTWPAASASIEAMPADWEPSETITLQAVTEPSPISEAFAADSVLLPEIDLLPPDLAASFINIYPQAISTNSAEIAIEPAPAPTAPLIAPATPIEAPALTWSKPPTPAPLPPAEPFHYSDDFMPALSLLHPPDPAIETISQDDLLDRGILIEEKLAEFRVKASVLDAYAGPVITRYEIEPAVGVRGAQIVNLMKDLARALGLVSIRVVETIPGKTCMGLELPNPTRQMIRLSEILSSDVYLQNQSKLTIALGKDITGAPVVTDLAKAPHMLVAGTTGSGKSVGVNAMILSLLYKATPEEVRFIMVDPKMLELSVYDGIPHLLAPVVTDMKLAANALNWCVAEMEKRYRLLSTFGVRNLAGFNQKIREAEQRGERLTNPFSLTPDEPEALEHLPFIVVVVDEFADLMMVAGKKIEELIARLAQKARAAGIHLILATQRPSVDVITGLIKANIPTRLAFQVSSKIDSRTILDQMGAEALLGQGDMLFLPPGSGYPQRIHGAFVDDDEVHRVVEHLKQFGEPNYIDGVLNGGFDAEASASNINNNNEGSESDPLYDEAVALVLKSRRASISAVQRQLRIGYNRAARLIDQMENAGIVSQMESNGNRTVLAPPAMES
ncbi:MAG: DNA translocase FtsK [Proteobacteria bacterium]|nr:DNA translocase FtsK [Pseudomonadota bacterium]